MTTAQERIRKAIDSGQGLEAAVDDWLSGLITDEELASGYANDCLDYDLDYQEKED